MDCFLFFQVRVRRLRNKFDSLPYEYIDIAVDFYTLGTQIICVKRFLWEKIIC